MNPKAEVAKETGRGAMIFYPYLVSSDICRAERRVSTFNKTILWVRENKGS